jgi:hypothetical protein
VSCTKVLPHKGPMAVGEIAVVYLLGVVCHVTLVEDRS